MCCKSGLLAVTTKLGENPGTKSPCYKKDGNKNLKRKKTVDTSDIWYIIERFAEIMGRGK